MKRMLDKNDKSTGSKNESSFKGDSIKIYNFFLNKLLTMSNDPFFNKKHQIYMMHNNKINNGPSFYERMFKDINRRSTNTDESFVPNSNKPIQIQENL